MERIPYEAPNKHTVSASWAGTNPLPKHALASCCLCCTVDCTMDCAVNCTANHGLSQIKTYTHSSHGAGCEAMGIKHVHTTKRHVKTIHLPCYYHACMSSVIPKIRIKIQHGLVPFQSFNRKKTSLNWGASARPCYCDLQLCFRLCLKPRIENRKSKIVKYFNLPSRLSRLCFLTH